MEQERGSLKPPGANVVDHLGSDHRSNGTERSLSPDLTNEDNANESEAETEINPSKNNTPRKPKQKVVQASPAASRSTMGDLTHEGMSKALEDGLGPLRHLSRMGGKRKARTSEVDERKATRQHPPGASPLKKQRLSPEADYEAKEESSESEYEPTLEMESIVPRLDQARRAASPRKVDPRRETHESDTQRVKREQHPAKSAPASFRASSQEIRPRSLSPRSGHQRSSSFQSTLPNSDSPRTSRFSRRSQPPAETTGHRPPLTPFTDSERRLRSTLRQTHSVDTDSTNTTMPARLVERTVDRYGCTPLMKACEVDDADVEQVQQLLEENMADLEYPDHAGNRPLHVAALNGHLEIVQLLLESNCEVDCTNDDSDTPLICAISNDFPKVALILLEHGANPWLKDGEYNMPRDLLTKISEESDRQDVWMALQKSAKSRERSLRNDFPEQHLPKHPKKDTSKMHEDLANPETMRQACLRGDLHKVNQLLRMRMRPSFASAKAATYGGHLDVLKLVVEDRFEDREHLAELVLEAIGRGYPKIIQYICDMQAFDPRAKVNGKIYSKVAADRSGPAQYLEQNILLNAQFGVERSGLHAQDRARSSTPRPGSAGTTGSATIIPRDADGDAQMREDTARPEKRRRLMTREERDAETEAKRQAYLETLPPTLRAALVPPHYPSRADIANQPLEERRWQRTLETLPAPLTIKRYMIDPVCPDGTEKDKYMPNVWASALFRQKTLGEVKAMAGLSWLPMTQGHKDALVGRLLGRQLSEDHRWHEALSPQIQREKDAGRYRHSWPVRTWNSGTTGAIDRPQVSYAHVKGEDWLRGAGPDEIYWVRWTDVARLMAECEHLDGIRLRSGWDLSFYEGFRQ